MRKRVVLTGGPCSGKTTIIRELEKRGYEVFHEVARKVLEERKEIEITTEEWKIRQEIIMERSLRNEEGEEETVFFDRGLIDGIAYSEFYGVETPGCFKVHNLKDRYSHVFLLDRLPFVDDGLRSESGDSDAQVIHDLIETEYTRFGYNVINVPVFKDEYVHLEIERRTNFILDRVEKRKAKAFFIDKDGTLVDNSGYPSIIPKSDILTKDVMAGLRLIYEMGYKIFIVSNQSWISKGKRTYEETEETFKEIIQSLKRYNIEIESYVYCPHKSADLCDCKKPKTKMINELIKKYNIDLEKSYVVGDMGKDILMGKNANIKTILVRTGKGKDFENEVDADFVLDNLNEVWRIL